MNDGAEHGNDKSVKSSTIKFLDLQALNEAYRPEIEEACKRVVASGWYVNGDEVSKFLRVVFFAEFLFRPAHAIGVGNGTRCIEA